MHLDIIFPQILILAVLAMVGVVGSKSGIITKDVNDMLAKVIFNITLHAVMQFQQT